MNGESKYRYLSIGSYLLAILIAACVLKFSMLGPTPTYMFFLWYLSFAFVPVGICFALVCELKNRSAWSGTILMILGLIMLLFILGFYPLEVSAVYTALHIPDLVVFFTLLLIVIAIIGLFVGKTIQQIAFHLRK